MHLRYGLLSTLLFAAAALLLLAGEARTAQDPAKDPTDQGGTRVEPDTLGRGILMPLMDPARGRKLFASKGCVVCHSVNGIGGKGAPPLDATTMPPLVNPFEFAARMWRLSLIHI